MKQISKGEEWEVPTQIITMPVKVLKVLKEDGGEGLAPRKVEVGSFHFSYSLFIGDALVC